MAGTVSPVLSESFDDVLHAVQETARGRWFLDEYAKRKQAEDTTVILAAIVKLESAVARMPEPTLAVEHAALEKAKSAIARAKAQIRNLAPEGSPLSEEAQLFARLAELSRKAHLAETAEGVRDTIARGVEVALKLVSDLDAELGPAAAAPPSPTGHKYFTQDRDIFEPPARSKDAADSETVTLEAVQPAQDVTENATELAKGENRPVVEPPEIHAKARPPALPPIPDTVSRGAKLTINRSVSPAGEDDTPATPVAVAAERASEQRIVIIRRTPDESIEVPLVDKDDNASAA